MAVPRPENPPLTRGVVLRGVGLAFAIALGGVAAWLIVTGTTQKRLEIGVLAGLWGLLIGAYAMFGARRHDAAYPDEDARVERIARIAAAEVAAEQGRKDLLVRDRGSLERADSAAARRDFEERLQQLLRREIDSAVTREVQVLRSEIAQLRQDLLEKVGGQLRLERIETTRLIGSDLEALHHEMRRLKVASSSIDDPTVASLRQVVEQVESAPVPTPPPAARQPGRLAGIVGTRATETPAEAGARAAPPPRTSAPKSAAARLQWALARASAPRSDPTESPGAADVAGSHVAEPTAAEPTAAPDAPLDTDPFASLPRLSPFTEFELDPVEEPAPVPANGGYSGRRRRHEAVEPSAAPEPAADAPAAQQPDPVSPAEPESPGVGRRRRAEGHTAAENLLARLLSREGAES